jgi:hypothetical protein
MSRMQKLASITIMELTKNTVRMQEQSVSKQRAMGAMRASTVGCPATSYYRNPARGRSKSDVKQERSQVSIDFEDNGRSPYVTYAQIIKVLHGSTSALNRPIPFAFLKSFPIISLALGLHISPSGQHAKLNILFYTCASLITGYKPYHDCLERKHPEVVHSYEEFDSAIPFDPI